MPRELQEAYSLPSQEQWGHCGRPGKCGQIPGLAVTQLGALLLPGSLSASSGRRRVGGCRPFLWALEEYWATQAQEQHGSVPGGPAKQPRSSRYVWVQNALRQPRTQSCQVRPPCSRPDCELPQHCQHCQLHTWVSSRISCAFGMGGGGGGEGGVLQEPKSVFVTIKSHFDCGCKC